MSAPDNRHAMSPSAPKGNPRDGENSQQAMRHTTPSGAAPAAPDSSHALVRTSATAPVEPQATDAARASADFDQASCSSGFTFLTPDWPGSQQATVSPAERSKVRAPVAQGSHRAMARTDTTVPPRGGQDSQRSMVRQSPITGTTAAPIVPEQQSHSRGVDHGAIALLLWDPVLQTLADGLDDIESTRIAQANRYRILTTTAEDSDGEVRGFGLGEDHPAVAALSAQLKTLEFLDASMTKALRTQLRAHPLHPWVKAQKGLGDKTVARLLAAVRDPYWNDLHDRPRTVGELFAFCGVAGPGQQRVRGQKVTWNPEARKRLWIITGPIIRGDGPYRDVYDAGRERYAEKTHTTACRQCGKKGQPAEVGTDWRDGHKHAGAIRLVMREVLRDLWTESQAIYNNSRITAEQAEHEDRSA